MIVAETERAAAQAAELIAIEWEQLPVVTDPFEAMTNAVLIHAEQDEGNAYAHYRIRKGNMAAGWAAADVIVEGTYHTPMQEHAYLQPEAGLGFVDERAGYGCRRRAVDPRGPGADHARPAAAGGPGARHLSGHWRRLWRARRYVCPDRAGAGGDEAARAWHRPAGPCRMVARREHYRPPQAAPVTIKTRWGATREGKITVVETEVVMDAGAYNYTSNKVLGNAHLMVSGPYEIPECAC
jgi:CO/xanthine dehydrogenase Mo-binding subunit